MICHLAHFARMIFERKTKRGTSPARPCNRFRMTQIFHSTAAAARQPCCMLERCIRRPGVCVDVRISSEPRVQHSYVHARDVASAKLDTARWSPTTTLFSYKGGERGKEKNEKERERTCAPMHPAGCIFKRIAFKFRGKIVLRNIFGISWIIPSGYLVYSRSAKKIKHALYYYSLGVAWGIIHNRIQFFGPHWIMRFVLHIRLNFFTAIAFWKLICCRIKI